MLIYHRGRAANQEAIGDGCLSERRRCAACEKKDLRETLQISLMPEREMGGPIMKPCGTPGMLFSYELDVDELHFAT